MTGGGRWAAAWTMEGMHASVARDQLGHSHGVTIIRAHPSNSSTMIKAIAQLPL